MQSALFGSSLAMLRLLALMLPKHCSHTSQPKQGNQDPFVRHLTSCQCQATGSSRSKTNGMAAAGIADQTYLSACHISTALSTQGLLNAKPLLPPLTASPYCFCLRTRISSRHRQLRGRQPEHPCLRAPVHSQLLNLERSRGGKTADGLVAARGDAQRHPTLQTDSERTANARRTHGGSASSLQAATDARARRR